MTRNIPHNYTWFKAAALSALLACGIGAQAQQIEEFSLIRENAVALNPAMVGAKGFLAGTLSFRKQFSEIRDAPMTAYLMMEGQVADKNFGVGASLIYDQTGPTGKTGLTVAASYQLNLDKKYHQLNEENVHYNTESRHMITFGLSVSLMQFRLNGSALHPEQGGDPELYSSRSYKMMPDAAFGIYYQWRNHLYAGISVPQIMGLNVNYTGRDGNSAIKTQQHLNFLLGGKIEVVKHKFSIDPVGALRWVKGAPIQGDIGTRLTFLDGLWVGATYRTSQYMVMDAGIEIKGLVRLCYAYDFNLSKYRADIGATHEATLAFKFNRVSVRDVKFLSGIGK